MSGNFAERYESLLGAVDARRAHLPYRLVSAVVIALALQITLGWTWIWLWAGFYCATQSAEGWVFRPDARHRWKTPSRARAFAIGCNFVAQACIFAWLSAPVWREGGPYGPVIATLIMVGAFFNLIVISRGSRLAFFAGAAPYLALGVYNMIADAGVAPNLRLLMTIGAVLVVANCFTAWKLTETAVEKEKAAIRESERRRLEAEAETAAKSSFVAMVSHELRTPISAILAGAAAMERAGTDAQGRSNAALIVDAGKMMRTLLDDLLDLSKLEAGKMSVETLAFDLRALVADTVRLWAPEARKKGLKVRLTGAAELPRWVEGDPTRLRQILNNLFSNAIKFTDQGSVTLGLAAADRGVAFVLKDTGRGLSPEQIAGLFTPFAQGDGAVARTHGGTGLGLAISRQLARLMGGDLTVQSAPGQGAAFIVHLPLAAAQAPAPAAALGTAGDPAPLPRLRVLAVDDHEINRRAMALLLQPLGVELTLAEAGDTALEILSAAPFDVVLMDVNMQGVNGLEATRRLRAAPGPNQMIPVIAVTGSASDEDLRACLAASMNARVVKPIDAAELYSALKATLEPEAQATRAA